MVFSKNNEKVLKGNLSRTILNFMSSAKGRAISLIERAEFWRINNQARMNNGTGLIANTYAPKGEIIPPAAASKAHPSRYLTTERADRARIVIRFSIFGSSKIGFLRIRFRRRFSSFMKSPPKEAASDIAVRASYFTPTIIEDS